jgi:predicted dehydrogenase
MAAHDESPALRGAVLGLGMIGRHHARLLQSSPRAQFAGAVDPGGDRFGVVHDPSRVFASLDELLAAGTPDFAIVAVPTEEHLPAVRALAAAGIHVLVEKPLAATAAEAEELIMIVEEAGLFGAVGHVERFNPALQGLRDRMGEIGAPILIATERIGPFPDRVRDVGVVKDLATHDLDLVSWIGGAPVQQVAAQTRHKMERAHEDMLFVTGRLANDVAFNCVVDWLSPTKVRQTRVLGDNGMLVADTLTGDLTIYENGSRLPQDAAVQQARGVSVGDMTRPALDWREPLLVELERFCDLIEGVPGAEVVTLAEGLQTVRCAEAVLASAADGTTVTL